MAQQWTVPTWSETEVLAADAFQVFGFDSAKDVPRFFKSGGLDEDARAHVTRAYRKLSLRFHPDKNPNAQPAFIHVKEQQETLLDDTRCVAAAAALLAAAGAAVAKEAQFAEGRAHADALERRMQQEARRKQHEEAEAVAKREAATAEWQRMVLQRDGGQATLIEQLRRALLTDVERLEEDILADWDVDPDVLQRKEVEVRAVFANLVAAAERRRHRA
jgi:curved DNA-binding protein CbpA